MEIPITLNIEDNKIMFIFNDMVWQLNQDNFINENGINIKNYLFEINNKENEIIENNSLGITPEISISIPQDISYTKANDFFEEIYIINSAKNVQQWTDIRKKCIDLKLYVTRFEGRDPDEREVKIDYYLLNKEKPNTLIRTIEDYSILLTYLRLYETIINYGEGENFLILEDDMMFHKNFRELFSKQVQLLPEDWNLWYLGATENPLFYDINESYIIKDIPFRYTSNNTRGLFAHGVKKSFIKKYLKPLLEQRLYSADESIVYNNLQTRANGVYTSFPYLCDHNYNYVDPEKEINKDQYKFTLKYDKNDYT